MRKPLLGLLAFGAVAATALFGAGRGQARAQSVTTSTDDHSAITDCDDVEIRFDHHRHTVRSEEQFTISKAQAPRLEARPSTNGGIRVQGWDRDEYFIKACKAAESDSELKQISVSVHDGRVDVRGPSSEHSWIVFLLIQAPKDAVLDLETKNGEIGLRDVHGKIEARTTNGPISLTKCSGEIRAHAENGPIDFAGNSGSLRLDTENGPLSIHLTGKEWEGAGLEGRTENGPLTLRLPDGYTSGIHVEATGYSPFDCEARACDQARGTWRSKHHGVEMGSGTPVVRMSTVNGPVSIESEDAED